MDSGEETVDLVPQSQVVPWHHYYIAGSKIFLQRPTNALHVGDDRASELGSDTEDAAPAIRDANN